MKKLFKNTSPEFYFNVMDGSQIRNVVELSHAIPQMSDDVFYSHVSEHSNDFSSWIRDVFNEHELAEKISQCNNKQETELALLRHIIHNKRR